MEKKYIASIIILLILILGFTIGSLGGPFKGSCTLKACYPQEENYTGELPCNSCSSVDRIFSIILISFNKECSAKQILVYEEGIKIDERLGNFERCEYDLDGPLSLIFG